MNRFYVIFVLFGLQAIGVADLLFDRSGIIQGGCLEDETDKDSRCELSCQMQRGLLHGHCFTSQDCYCIRSTLDHKYTERKCLVKRDCYFVYNVGRALCSKSDPEACEFVCKKWYQTRKYECNNDGWCTCWQFDYEPPDVALGNPNEHSMMVGDSSCQKSEDCTLACPSFYQLQMCLYEKCFCLKINHNYKPQLLCNIFKEKEQCDIVYNLGNQLCTIEKKGPCKTICKNVMGAEHYECHRLDNVCRCFLPHPKLLSTDRGSVFPKMCYLAVEHCYNLCKVLFGDDYDSNWCVKDACYCLTKKGRKEPQFSNCSENEDCVDSLSLGQFLCGTNDDGACPEMCYKEYKTKMHKCSRRTRECVCLVKKKNFELKRVFKMKAISFNKSEIHEDKTDPDNNYKTDQNVVQFEETKELSKVDVEMLKTQQGLADNTETKKASIDFGILNMEREQRDVDIKVAKLDSTPVMYDSVEISGPCQEGQNSKCYHSCKERLASNLRQQVCVDVEVCVCLARFGNRKPAFELCKADNCIEAISIGYALCQRRKTLACERVCFLEFDTLMSGCSDDGHCLCGMFIDPVSNFETPITIPVNSDIPRFTRAHLGQDQLKVLKFIPAKSFNKSNVARTTANFSSESTTPSKKTTTTMPTTTKTPTMTTTPTTMTTPMTSTTPTTMTTPMTTTTPTTTTTSTTTTKMPTTRSMTKSSSKTTAISGSIESTTPTTSISSTKDVTTAPPTITSIPSSSDNKTKEPGERSYVFQNACVYSPGACLKLCLDKFAADFKRAICVDNINCFCLKRTGYLEPSFDECRSRFCWEANSIGSTLCRFEGACNEMCTREYETKLSVCHKKKCFCATMLDTATNIRKGLYSKNEMVGNLQWIVDGKATDKTIPGLFTFKSLFDRTVRYPGPCEDESCEAICKQRFAGDLDHSLCTFQDACYCLKKKNKNAPHSVQTCSNEICTKDISLGAGLCVNSERACSLMCYQKYAAIKDTCHMDGTCICTINVQINSLENPPSIIPLNNSIEQLESLTVLPMSDKETNLTILTTSIKPMFRTKSKPSFKNETAVTNDNLSKTVKPLVIYVPPPDYGPGLEVRYNGSIPTSSSSNLSPLYQDIVRKVGREKPNIDLVKTFIEERTKQLRNILGKEGKDVKEITFQPLNNPKPEAVPVDNRNRQHHHHNSLSKIPQLSVLQMGHHQSSSVQNRYGKKIPQSSVVQNSHGMEYPQPSVVPIYDNPSKTYENQVIYVPPPDYGPGLKVSYDSSVLPSFVENSPRNQHPKSAVVKNSPRVENPPLFVQTSPGNEYPQPSVVEDSPRVENLQPSFVQNNPRMEYPQPLNAQTSPRMEYPQPSVVQSSQVSEYTQPLNVQTSPGQEFNQPPSVVQNSPSMEYPQPLNAQTSPGIGYPQPSVVQSSQGSEYLQPLNVQTSPGQEYNQPPSVVQNSPRMEYPQPLNAQTSPGIGYPQPSVVQSSQGSEYMQPLNVQTSPGQEFNRPPSVVQNSQGIEYTQPINAQTSPGIGYPQPSVVQSSQGSEYTQPLNVQTSPGQEFNQPPSVVQNSPRIEYPQPSGAQISPTAKANGAAQRFDYELNPISIQARDKNGNFVPYKKPSDSEFKANQQNMMVTRNLQVVIEPEQPALVDLNSMESSGNSGRKKTRYRTPHKHSHVSKDVTEHAINGKHSNHQSHGVRNNNHRVKMDDVVEVRSVESINDPEIRHAFLAKRHIVRTDTVFDNVIKNIINNSGQSEFMANNKDVPGEYVVKNQNGTVESMSKNNSKPNEDRDEKNSRHSEFMSENNSGLSETIENEDETEDAMVADNSGTGDTQVMNTTEHGQIMVINHRDGILTRLRLARSAQLNPNTPIFSGNYEQSIDSHKGHSHSLDNRRKIVKSNQGNFTVDFAPSYIVEAINVPLGQTSNKLDGVVPAGPNFPSIEKRIKRSVLMVLNPSESETANINPSESETAIINPSESETAIINPGESETAIVNPGESETAIVNPGESETAIINPGESEAAIVNPGESETAIINPGESETAILNPGESETAILNPGESETAILNPSESETAIINSGESETAILNPGESETAILNPGESETAILNPGESETAIINPGESETAILNPGESETAILNPGESETGILNPGESETAIINPGESETAIINPGESEAAIVNPGESETAIINPGESETAILNPGESETAIINPRESETAIINPGESETAIINPGESETTIINPGESETAILNPGESETAILNPGESETGILNPGESETAIINPGESETAILNPGESETGIINPGESETAIINPSESETSAVKSTTEFVDNRINLENLTIAMDLKNNSKRSTDEMMMNMVPKCSICNQVPCPHEPFAAPHLSDMSNTNEALELRMPEPSADVFQLDTIEAPPILLPQNDNPSWLDPSSQGTSYSFTPKINGPIIYLPPEIPITDRPIIYPPPEIPKTEGPIIYLPPEIPKTEDPIIYLPPEIPKTEDPIIYLPPEIPKTDGPIIYLRPEIPRTDRPVTYPPEIPKTDHPISHCGYIDSYISVITNGCHGNGNRSACEKRCLCQYGKEQLDTFYCRMGRDCICVSRLLKEHRTNTCKGGSCGTFYPMGRNVNCQFDVIRKKTCSGLCELIVNVPTYYCDRNGFCFCVRYDEVTTIPPFVPKPGILDSVMKIPSTCKESNECYVLCRNVVGRANLFKWMCLPSKSCYCFTNHFLKRVTTHCDKKGETCSKQYPLGPQVLCGPSHKEMVLCRHMCMSTVNTVQVMCFNGYKLCFCLHSFLIEQSGGSTTHGPPSATPPPTTPPTTITSTTKPPPTATNPPYNPIMPPILYFKGMCSICDVKCSSVGRELLLDSICVNEDCYCVTRKFMQEPKVECTNGNDNCVTRYPFGPEVRCQDSNKCDCSLICLIFHKSEMVSCKKSGECTCDVKYETPEEKEKRLKGSNNDVIVLQGVCATKELCEVECRKKMKYNFGNAACDIDGKCFCVSKQFEGKGQSTCTPNGKGLFKIPIPPKMKCDSSANCRQNCKFLCKMAAMTTDVSCETSGICYCYKPFRVLPKQVYTKLISVDDRVRVVRGPGFFPGNLKCAKACAQVLNASTIANFFVSADEDCFCESKLLSCNSEKVCYLPYGNCDVYNGLGRNVCSNRGSASFKICETICLGTFGFPDVSCSPDGTYCACRVEMCVTKINSVCDPPLVNRDSCKPPNPDKAKPPNPDKAKPPQPDKAKPPQPDKAKPPQPDKAKPPQPDKAKPPQPDKAKPPQPDKDEPPQPDKDEPPKPTSVKPPSPESAVTPPSVRNEFPPSNAGGFAESGSMAGSFSSSSSKAGGSPSSASESGSFSGSWSGGSSLGGYKSKRSTSVDLGLGDSMSGSFRFTSGWDKRTLLAPSSVRGNSSPFSDKRKLPGLDLLRDRDRVSHCGETSWSFGTKEPLIFNGIAPMSLSRETSSSIRSGMQMQFSPNAPLSFDRKVQRSLSIGK